jgi:tripartite-type tricarboxylate transporter receptor subunit TctC
MVRCQKFHWVIVFAGILMLTFALKAEAAYPEKPITLYVAMSAGGSADTAARALCASAEKFLGQPFAIINKEGGGGSTGLALVANEKPDGYTLCVAQHTGVVRTPLRRKVNFKPLASFTNIYGFAKTTSGLQVRLDAPWKNLGDLIAFAKANPGKVKFTSAGLGTPLHMAMHIIAKKEGIAWNHVPFDGAGEMAAAVMGGHVDVMHGAMVFSKTQGLRALAACTQKRMEEFPDVPTMIELGYGFYNDTYTGVFGPAGIDPAKVKILEDAFAKAIQEPKFLEAAKNFMLIVEGSSSAEYTKFLEDSWSREEALYIDAGLIKKAATEPR